MRSKIKLLAIEEGMPFPPNCGGAQAIFNSLRLLQDYVELHLIIVSSGFDVDSKYNLEKELDKTTISYIDLHDRDRYEVFNAISKKFRTVIMKLANLCGDEELRNNYIGLDSARYFNVFKEINEYIREHKIDLVQTEFYRPLFWIQGIVEPVKKVFVQHEIQYVVNQQRLQGKSVDTNLILKWGINKNRELAMMNAYDAIITLSKEDKIKLEQAGVKIPVYSSFAKVCSPQTVDVDYSKFSMVDLVFVGPENHLPNAHGLNWFLETVWDGVLNIFPSIKLHVIGNWSSSAQSLILSKYRNVIFDGFVKDLADAIKGKLMIVPIFEGSGIRMKILEAANCYVPFVGSTIGAEGLSFEHGVNCLIADDSEAFKNAIISLISDPKEMQRLSIAAKEHVINCFSDEKFVQSRMSCYESLITK